MSQSCALVECGNAIAAGRSAVYCSQRCRARAAYLRRRVNKHRATCRIDDCDGVVAGQGATAFCADHRLTSKAGTDASRLWRERNLVEARRMERLSYERRRVVRSCRLCAATVYGRGAVAYCETCRGSDDARRDSYLRQAFKMTLAEYRLMLARQGGTCAVSDCMAEPTVVDHDHACCDRAGSSCGACVRGLLCHNHNVLIGLAHDSAETLRAAADYVDRANTFALTERDTAA